MSEDKLRKEIEKGKRWTKPITKAPTFKTIPCPPYHEIKDYHQDDGCFFLIKVYLDDGEIGVGVCDYTMTLLVEYRGTQANQIYSYILNNSHYVTRYDHAAYLGKELMRARLALENGKEYLQS